MVTLPSDAAHDDDLVNDLVATGMSERAVDRLETVEIEPQDRERGRALARLGNEPACLDHAGTAIRKRGQCV